MPSRYYVVNMQELFYAGPTKSRRTITHSPYMTVEISTTPIELPGGGALEWQEGYQARPWTHKSTLITYFSGMKIDPKYAFLHACHVLFKICLYDQKHTLFFNFARFYTRKRCLRVQCLVLKNNPNYMNFWTSLIPPLTFECPPPRESYTVVKKSPCSPFKIPWLKH